MNLVTTPATGCKLPRLDAPGVEVWRDGGGTVCAVAYRRGVDYCLYVPNIGQFVVQRRSGEIRLVPDASAGDELIEDAFHRIALPLALQLHGRQVLHASAVLIDGGVVALCGRSGTGKSTLAYALSRRGHELWGDDAVAFEADGGSVIAHPLAFRTRLRPASAAWFGDAVNVKGFERSLPWRHGSSPAEVRAVFVVEQAATGAANAPEIRRLAPVEAFTAVLPHAYYLTLDDQDLNRRLLSAYMAAADHLPVFELRYVPGLELLDRMVERIEGEVAAL